MTHFPGHWPDEKLRKMSSRDWQAGYESPEHLAETCTDTHESCVVTRRARAARKMRNRTSYGYIINVHAKLLEAYN